MLELKKVTEDNLWKIVGLSVNEDQKLFVADNAVSIMQAYVTITSGSVALPYGIFDGEDYVGFVMFGYGTTGDDDEPDVADNNYCIWRFMIDKNYQKKGLGKEALDLIIKFLKEEAPCGKSKGCWLSYESENIVAKSLYASFGFAENGEMCGDEIVAYRDL